MRCFLQPFNYSAQHCSRALWVSHFKSHFRDIPGEARFAKMSSCRLQQQTADAIPASLLLTFLSRKMVKMAQTKIMDDENIWKSHGNVWWWCMIVDHYHITTYGETWWCIMMQHDAWLFHDPGPCRAACSWITNADEWWCIWWCKCKPMYWQFRS